LKDVAGYDLVIEAVPESLDLKLSIMKGLDQIVSPDTILASNTSAIPIAQLGNFLMTPYLIAAVRMFDEGFASREDNDAAMKLGAGRLGRKSGKGFYDYT